MWRRLGDYFRLTTHFAERGTGRWGDLPKVICSSSYRAEIWTQIDLLESSLCWHSHSGLPLRTSASTVRSSSQMEKPCVCPLDGSSDCALILRHVSLCSQNMNEEVSRWFIPWPLSVPSCGLISHIVRSVSTVLIRILSSQNLWVSSNGIFFNLSTLRWYVTQQYITGKKMWFKSYPFHETLHKNSLEMCF